MTLLLDTNVVSELRKRPGVIAPEVLAWSESQLRADLYVSVITVMEIEFGIARLARRDSRQAAVLTRWLEHDVLDEFRGRILPVDVAVARRAARLHVPDPRPERDGYIAATAREFGLTVVTRNVADFESLSVPVINPWDFDSG
ncbi:type II toxin-antitoxin system VapC family toxin [Gordonia sp. TBRC 11910]|uniref:Ribonuclease VapC n=1 Tax=Gordonia asplenii TaxID=2725283 RepID=A0A848L0S7_9ACTN|nr:type II toxin-antitoxin system VapC family toxin [Gordonia asplenii]NMO02101.1 type II toxin-antitoxin system VapC family toxin [Gordonia asplenii]